MPAPIIEFRNFSFQYFSQAEPTLHQISLTIHEGEKVLIVGPSGCGKSTLANCMNGLIPFSYKGSMKGSLLINGEESSQQSLFQISKTVGTVLQDSDSQFIGMTVAEDLAFAPENDMVPRPELHRLVAEIAETVDVTSHLQHAPSELSGGQKQRIAIGGILTDKVRLLLFDEPLANLDPATGKTAIELIDHLQKQTGAAVVIIEHRLEDVLHRDVDRIVLMADGRILFDGLPDQLLASDLLIENGIREPLYVTALKYAGIPISETQRPHNIAALRLDAGEKKKVQDWYQEMPASSAKPKDKVLLDAEHLHFTYDNGFKALKDISLQIHAGELLAVCGKNGAGKSTFSKVICGFEKQQSGNLTFLGENMMELSVKERADRIGFVLQSPNQMISQTMIKDEVALGLNARKVPDSEIEEKTAQALKVCGLYPFRNWPVSALSFGQKKRLTIASIFVLDPQIIILDEPTAGQDFRHYTEIMEFLLDLSKRGIAIVLITHDMHLMQEYAERAVVFNDGKIIADDNPAAILTNPEIIAEANLKETSLFSLAKLCEIPSGKDFVRKFIDYERTLREAAQSQSDGTTSGTAQSRSEETTSETEKNDG